MRKLGVLLFFFTVSVAVYAQPNLKLDTALGRLNRRFEKVESIKRLPEDKNKKIRLERAIRSAENALGRFKKKYPKHDISTFERDLANFKSGKTPDGTSESISRSSSSNISSYAKAENLIETIDEILRFLPDTRKFLQNDKNAVELTKQKLERFRNKMKNVITPEFIGLANDDSNRKIKRALDKVRREAKSLKSNLSRIDVKRIKNETKQNLMLSRYFRVLFAQEKLRLLGKIYQNHADVKAASKIADDLIAKLGTIDDIEKQGAANYAALVAKRRLFPNRQKNRSLKNQAIRAFKSSIFTRGKFSSSQILKVHLVSSGWSVQRNKVTGIILSRDQQAQLAVKTADGKCHAYLILLEQKYKGGGRYGGAYMRSGSHGEMLCKNIPK